MRKKEGGFTLLEVMVAMAILSIGILGIMGLQFYITKGVSSGNVVTNELYLASVIMEQQYKLENEKKSLTMIGINEDGREGSAGPYTVKTTVSEPLDGKYSRFIIVRVSLGDGFVGREVVYKTLMQGRGA